MFAVARLLCLLLFSTLVGLLVACDSESSGGGSSGSDGSSGGSSSAQTGNTPTANEESLAQQVLTLLNQERAAQSLPP